MTKKKSECVKLFIGSDFHTGNFTGLTPPDYQRGTRKQTYRQAEVWEWFESEAKKHGPFDGAFLLGDLVDGPGVKDASETIINLNQQIDSALICLQTIDSPPKKTYMLYGTRVHVITQDGLEMEQIIAKQYGCHIYGHLQINVNGYVLDCRHQASSRSGVKATRGSVLAKERASNEQWHLEGVQSLAQLILRAHTHWLYTDGEPNRWQGWMIPPLQDLGSKFGVRQLSQTVMHGFGVLSINGHDWPQMDFIECPRKKQKLLRF